MSEQDTKTLSIHSTSSGPAEESVQQQEPLSEKRDNNESNVGRDTESQKEFLNEKNGSHVDSKAPEADSKAEENSREAENYLDQRQDQLDPRDGQEEAKDSYQQRSNYGQPYQRSNYHDNYYRRGYYDSHGRGNSTGNYYRGRSGNYNNYHRNDYYHHDNRRRYGGNNQYQQNRQEHDTLPAETSSSSSSTAASKSNTYDSPSFDNRNTPSNSVSSSQNILESSVSPSGRKRERDFSLQQDSRLERSSSQQDQYGAEDGRDYKRRRSDEHSQYDYNRRGGNYSSQRYAQQQQPQQQQYQQQQQHRDDYYQRNYTRKNSRDISSGAEKYDHQRRYGEYGYNRTNSAGTTGTGSGSATTPTATTTGVGPNAVRNFDTYYQNVDRSPYAPQPIHTQSVYTPSNGASSTTATTGSNVPYSSHAHDSYSHSASSSTLPHQQSQHSYYDTRNGQPVQHQSNLQEWNQTTQQHQPSQYYQGMGAPSHYGRNIAPTQSSSYGAASMVSSQQPSAVPVGQPTEKSILPPHIREYFDQNAGRPYYYNTITQQSTWERPS